MPDAQDKKYGVIIQARLSSSRLPGKVLKDVAGRPLIQWQYLRLRQNLPAEIPVVIATSEDGSDDSLAEYCNKQEIPVFRGSLNDVRQRMIDAAEAHVITHILRVGGDDPMVDAGCVKALIAADFKGYYDFIFASNRDGWPYGCAAEMIRRDSLEVAKTISMDSLYTEHTIPIFFDFPSRFKVLRFESPTEIRRPDVLLSIDYPEDFQKVAALIEHFGEKTINLSIPEIATYLDAHPEIAEINRHLHKGFDH
ncbi:hypothetical protein OAG10_06725 [Verrucomicrobia bacterium]|nr:hypothetical protein [Verrucomicrobiota bacterium]